MIRFFWIGLQTEAAEWVLYDLKTKKDLREHLTSMIL